MFKSESFFRNRDFPVRMSNYMLARFFNVLLFLSFADNPDFIPGGIIPVEEFEGHVRRLHANGDILFSQEYAALHPTSDTTCNETLAQENRHKNRYNNIVAYDHSRVKLDSISNVPGSDYINANYLNGYNKEKAYIATQGPLPETAADFWRMVWEQNSKIIVMVSKQTHFTAGPLLFVNFAYSILQKNCSATSLFKCSSFLYVFNLM